MRKTTRIASLFCTLLLLSMALPALATTDGALSCADVAAWVAENPDLLPTTLAEFQSIPDGYETGVYKALPQELRSEMWNEFLDEFVAAQPGLAQAEVQQIVAFRNALDRPEDFMNLEAASQARLQDLLSSFTLHIMDPVADLVVETEELQARLAVCYCSYTYDPGCTPGGCAFTQWGCGPGGTEPCTGRY